MSAVEIGSAPTPLEALPEIDNERKTRIKQLQQELTIIDGCLDYEMGPAADVGRHPLTENKSYEELLHMLKDRRRELVDLKRVEN